jgi:hypothetical protein
MLEYVRKCLGTDMIHASEMHMLFCGGHFGLHTSEITIIAYLQLLFCAVDSSPSKSYSCLSLGPDSRMDLPLANLRRSMTSLSLHLNPVIVPSSRASEQWTWHAGACFSLVYIVTLPTSTVCLYCNCILDTPASVGICSRP